MSKKGAPLITRYECNTAPEGYNYVIIQNNDETAIFKESVEYIEFSGLTICGKQGSSNKYELIVGPGGTQTVLMKAALTGFSATAQITQSIKHETSTLRRMCLEADKKERIRGSDIWKYELQHDFGMFFLYVNKTTDKILTEDIEYALEGLEVINQDDKKKVQVRVGPGSEQIVQLGATEGAWKIAQAMKQSVTDVRPN